MKILSSVAIGLVMIYRYGFAWIKPKTCRFEPTCSEYAITALRRHGPFKGAWLALRRIVRCHPWGGSGFDPVP